jgi:hypothetical protein
MLETNMTNSVGEKLEQQRKGNNWMGRIKSGLEWLGIGDIWGNGSNNEVIPIRVSKRRVD